MKVAENREFQDYRTDVALDTRNVKLALRRLRQLTRTGGQVELDIDETVDKTCREAGEIELVFDNPLKTSWSLVAPVPFADNLEDLYKPGAEKIASAVREVLEYQTWEATASKN